MAKVRVSQIGHLASSPTLQQYGHGENAGVRAWVAVISNVRFTDQDTGEVREKTTRISWTLFGKTAENAVKYLRTGSQVAVWGRVETDQFEKDGETVYSTSFIGEELQYLDSKEVAEMRAQKRD